MAGEPTGGDRGARAVAALLAWGRVGIGASIWLMPRASMRVLGFAHDNAEVMAIARLAGTRDLALGGIALACTGDRRATTTITRLNAAVDAFDSLAFAIALLRRRGIDRAALMGTVSAAAAAVVGVAAANSLQSGVDQSPQA